MGVSASPAAVYEALKVDQNNLISELPAILVAVEVSLGRRDETVRTDLPNLETTNVHGSACPTRSGIGSRQCPVIDDPFVLQVQVIHHHFHIRKRGHESLRHVGDCFTTDSG